MNMINHHAAAPCLLTNAATPAMQESYNRIRVNLLARAGLGSERGCGTVCPVIGVTSVVRHRSRRYLAANLAISFARLGMRVLLVDADYRSEGLAPLLEVAEGGGIAARAAGREAAPVQALLPTLHVLGRGLLEGNPADFVGSTAFFAAIEGLRDGYDAIFISLPPVTAYADAATAAPALSGMVLGVTPGHDRRQSVTEAVNTLQGVGVPLYGMVACEE